MKRYLPEIAGWTYLTFFCLALHFINPQFTNADSWYHTRLSSFFPELLFARTFPTTAYSIWAESWADKEVLFHIYLMPFVQIPSFEIIGTKLACALLVLGFAVALAARFRRR